MFWYVMIRGQGCCCLRLQYAINACFLLSEGIAYISAACSAVSCCMQLQLYHFFKWADDDNKTGQPGRAAAVCPALAVHDECVLSCVKICHTHCEVLAVL